MNSKSQTNSNSYGQLMGRSASESKTSTVYKFTTHEEFEEFLDG